MEDTARQHIDWYFDVISPYAYLQAEQLDQIPARYQIRYKPVLFAGLLNHWGHIGPAELAPKRMFTFRHVRWLAHYHQIPLNFPKAHPFNPLPLLRLAYVVGDDLSAIQRIFRFVWQDRQDPHDMNAVFALAKELGLDDPAQRLQSSEVKQGVARYGEEAIADGVFGVPTFVVRGVALWGQDALQMLHTLLEQPDFFHGPSDQVIASLPAAATRSR